MIPIYNPYINKYKKSALKAIEDEWISNYGVNVTNSEEKLKNILNIPYCILMNNGTSATHCLFLSLKFKYPNIKKIYVPNNVFVAAWNTCLMQFLKDQIEVMETDENTLNIKTDEDYIKNLSCNSAVLIVHNLGNVVNVPRLKRLRKDLIFIEDNCEGLFGKYEEIYSGCSKDSLCSSASFYGNKTLTTGEGGAFLTHDKELYDYIKSCYSHGMTQTRYIHDKIAYNYRMTNVQAGFLYDQLSDISNILQLKNIIFKNYDNLLHELISNGTIKKIQKEEKTKNSKWMYCIITSVNFEKIEKYMEDSLVQVRPFFYDIRCHKHLQDINVSYEPLSIFNNGVMLPSYPGLLIEQQEYIVNCLKECIKSI